MTPEERAQRIVDTYHGLSNNTAAGLQADVTQAIRDAEQRAALELAKEWGMVIATLATSVMECLETVKDIQMKPGIGHPFYRGQMSLLQTLRRMADDDLRRYGGETSEEPAHAPR